jgi:hypothetical protein
MASNRVKKISISTKKLYFCEKYSFTRMNRKIFATVIVLMAFPFLSMAQNRNGIKARPKQLFKLEDLIPGGSTYYLNSVPPSKYTAWWGDECLHLELDKVSVIDKKAYDGKTLFTLSDINEALGNQGTLRHLYSVSFPSERTEVLFSNYYKLFLVDWKEKKVVWSLPLDTTATATDFHEESRNLAFVKDHNLYVTNAEGKTAAVSTDGTLTLTYGGSVHRDEFGIRERLAAWVTDKFFARALILGEVILFCTHQSYPPLPHNRQMLLLYSRLQNTNHLLRFASVP